MIKKHSINKIIVSSLSLILLLMFYFFPTNVDYNEKITLNNIPLNEEVVYLLDSDNYVSQVITYFSQDNIKDIIIEKIDILTHGDKFNEDFLPLIPNDTELKKVIVEKSQAHLYFSNEILNAKKELENKMIEAIVFSITEINGINEVYIYVNDSLMKELPNSKKQLNYPLTRKYGINTTYDITSLLNLDKTTIYFSKTLGDINYYVPVTKVVSEKVNKIDIIVEELKSSVHAQDNFNILIPSECKLIDYKIEGDKMNLVFNEYIFNIDGKILESVQYVLNKSIKENYDVKEVTINK